MSDRLSHEDISARFLEAGAVNFDAVGEFVSKVGPELVIHDDGLHGVLYGRFNTLACVLPAEALVNVFGSLRAAGLAEAINLPRG